VINLVVPFVIKPLTSLEFYKDPQTVFYLNIARTLLARVAICGTYLALVFGSKSYFFNKSGFVGCWENEIGQILYELLMFEFFLNLVHTLGAFLLYRILRCTRWAQKWEFDVSLGILELVYRQGLVFVGQFFCPFLVIIQALQLLVLFYQDFLYLRVTCRPLRKTFRLGNGTSVFTKVQELTRLLPCSAPLLSILAPPTHANAAHTFG